MFTTKRLRLRGYKPSTDLENLKALNDDPRVATWTALDWKQTSPLQEDWAEFIKKIAESCVFFAVVETLVEDDPETPSEFVGMLLLGPLAAPKNRSTDLGIAIVPKHQSKGYGGELMGFILNHAFEEMGMHRVSLGVFEGNDGAINLYKRWGFVEEVRQRKLIWMKGGWRDVIYMGILDEEWAARKKSDSESLLRKEEVVLESLKESMSS